MLDTLEQVVADQVTFVHKRRPAWLDECLHHRPVIPKRPFPATHEALPDFLAQSPVIAENAARIVELVGGADELDRRRLVANSCDVGQRPASFPLQPLLARPHDRQDFSRRA